MISRWQFNVLVGLLFLGALYFIFGPSVGIHTNVDGSGVTVYGLLAAYVIDQGRKRVSDNRPKKPDDKDEESSP